MFQPRFILILLLATTLLGSSLAAHAASPAADQIFPNTTKGFVSIRNLNDFGEQWKKTQFGQLLDDPLMQNFKNEVQKQLTELSKKTFGLTFDEISSLPSGEIALGMIAPPDQIPGYVLTMDVAGKRSEADSYLTNLTQRLLTVGVKQSTETYNERQITILVFPTVEKLPTISTPRGNITFEPAERRAHYMFVQDVLIASDQLHLLKLIADRTANQTSEALADVESYQVVMKRCISDLSNATPPAIRWYIEPLDYGDSIRVLMRNSIVQNRREKPSIFSVLKKQGFDALQGLGGVITVKTEEQEAVYRTFIYTKKPYRLAMRMLEFPDQTNFVPPDWMPNDLARCTMFYVDPLAIFDNVGALFDAFLGDEGMWKGILEGLEKDPHGPQINLREELISNLGTRVLGMSRYAKPITINSESMVVAIELRTDRESAMLAGVEKLFGNDPEMMVTEHNSYKIWHRLQTPEGGFTPIDIEAPDIFAPMSGTGITSPANVNVVLVTQRSAPAGDEEDRPPLFPEGGIVVAKGCLFVATDIEYLKVILDRLDAPSESATTAIHGTSEYKDVNRVFSGLGITNKPHFFQFFARTDESLRPTYEIIRQNRMAQSQALLAKVLNMLLAPDEESGTRKQVFDGSTLPEFDRVERYFGKVGIYGVSENDGYFIKGFSLER